MYLLWRDLYRSILEQILMISFKKPVLKCSGIRQRKMDLSGLCNQPIVSGLGFEEWGRTGGGAVEEDRGLMPFTPFFPLKCSFSPKKVTQMLG